MDVQDAEARLIALDARLGKGVGAVKERAQLQAVIDNVNEALRSRRAERLARNDLIRVRKERRRER